MVPTPPDQGLSILGVLSKGIESNNKLGLGEVRILLLNKEWQGFPSCGTKVDPFEDYFRN